MIVPGDSITIRGCTRCGAWTVEESYQTVHGPVVMTLERRMPCQTPHGPGDCCHHDERVIDPLDVERIRAILRGEAK